MTCTIPYAQLAAFSSGDLDREEHRRVEEHLPHCERCRTRLHALTEIDRALPALAAPEPSAGAILAARRHVAEARDTTPSDDIMTPDEVAAFLRLPLDALDELLGELPAFEIGGRVRVRREALERWIEERECAYQRQVTTSWLARGMTTERREGAA